MAISLKNLLGSGVKSIQRGSTTVASGAAPPSVTISSVMPSKVVVISNYRVVTNANGVSGSGYAEIVGPTTISITVAASTAGVNVIVYWQVVEYY